MNIVDTGKITSEYIYIYNTLYNNNNYKLVGDGCVEHKIKLKRQINKQ
jgi:hypothetical protein